MGCAANSEQWPSLFREASHRQFKAKSANFRVSKTLSSSSKSLRDRAAAQLGGRPACSRRLVAAPRAAKAKSAACRRTTGSCSSRLVADASRLSGARISARGRRRWAPLKLVLPGERGPTRACALCSAAMREFNNSFFIARSTEHRAQRPALMYTPLTWLLFAENIGKNRQKRR